MKTEPKPKAKNLRSNAAPVSLADIKATLITAGEVVRGWWDRPQTAVFEKDDRSPLTLADIETNRFLQQRLSELLPGAGWLSEESKDDLKRCEKNWVWIVDPLDGTREFVRRIPEVSISIGLARSGQVVLGGVYNPITGEGGVGDSEGTCDFWGMFYPPVAHETLGNASASVSRREIDDGSILPYLHFFRETRIVGSVAYKLLRVAAGWDDLTFSVQGKWEWDICGGIGLLFSTGKVYQRMDGKPCEFNVRIPRIHSGTMAGPQGLICELAKEVAAVWQKHPNFSKRGFYVD